MEAKSPVQNPSLLHPNWVIFPSRSLTALSDLLQEKDGAKSGDMSMS